MAHKVVILVDNSGRDLLPSLLLKREFESQGVKAYLCNKRNFKIVTRRVEPDAFLISRGDMPFARDIAECCNLYLVPSEGGRLTAETMKSVFLGRTHTRDGKQVQLDQKRRVIESFDYLKRVYLWGAFTYSFLKAQKILRDDQLLIVGNGRLDLYRASKRLERGRSDVLNVGIAYSAKTICAYPGRYNYIETLFGLDYASTLPMVPAGRHYEDWAWRDFAVARQMLNIIKKIIIETDYRINLRIGPFENVNDYHFLTERYPDRVYIQKEGETIASFLENNDVLLTCSSTIGLEALVMQVPVISILFTLDYDHLIRHVDPKANGFDTILRCYHTPKSDDEVMGLLRECKTSGVPYSPDIPYAQQFLKDMYNWPSEKSATKAIVDNVVGDLKKLPVRAGDRFEKNLAFSGWLEGLIKYIPLSKKMNIILLELFFDVSMRYRDYRLGTELIRKREHSLTNKSVERAVEEASLGNPDI